MIRLVSCHIENFGNLEAVDFDFNSGIHVFLENNGWGKSTLTAFLKSMFYGLPKVKEKALPLLSFLKDRERYMPWNGGRFGGWLLFEHNGRLYKIVRYFGKTEKSDHVQFLEMYGDSGKEISDFKDPIGNELFGIDVDSFERSVFITSDPSRAPLNLHNVADVSGVKAKLVSMVEQIDDGTDYQEVHKRISDAIFALKSSDNKNATGELPTLKRVVDGLKENIRKAEGDVELAQKKEKGIEELLQKKQLIDENLKALGIEKKACILASVKKQYEDLEKKLHEEEENRKKVLAVLNNNEVTDEIIQQLDNLNNTLLKSEGELAVFTDKDSARLGDINTKFGVALISDEELACYQKLFSKAKDLESEVEKTKLSEEVKQEFEELKEHFVNSTDLGDELKTLKGFLDKENILTYECSKQKKELQEKQEKRNEIETNFKMTKRDQTRKFKNIVCFFLFLAAVYLFYMGNIIPAVATIISIVLLFKWRKNNFSTELENCTQECCLCEKNLQEIREALVNIRSEIKNFLALKGYSALDEQLQDFYQIFHSDIERYGVLLKQRELAQEKVNRLSEEYKNIKEQIDSFWAIYKPVFMTEDQEYVFKKIQEIRIELNNLKIKEKQVAETLEKRKLSMAAFNEIIKNYNLENYNTESEKLDVLKRLKTQLEFLNGSIKADLQKRANFLADKEFEEFISSNQTIRDVNVVDEEYKASLEQRDAITEAITAIRGEIDSLRKESFLIPELEAKLEQSSAKLEKTQEKYEQLLLVRSFIEEAHKQMAERYMLPMMNRFKYYWSAFSVAFNVSLNIDFEVLLDEAGEAHDIRYFSAGYRDLVNLCARLALVDVLFENTDMFIILDDPFINFDAAKIDVIRGVLKELSNKRQVLYLTCHESRGI